MDNSSELYTLSYGNYSENNNGSFTDADTIDLMKYIIPITIIIGNCISLIVGIPGNGLVIWIAGFKMKNISGVWILNLAITDLICNIFIPLQIIQRIAYLKHWMEMFKFLLSINSTILIINMFTSVSFLTAISIDRCVSIMFPIWAKLHRTRKLVTNTVITIWVFSVILSLPHLVYMHIYRFTPFFQYKDTTNYSDTTKQQIIKIQNVLYIIKAVLMFLVPFIIILVCYCLIIFKLKTIKRRSRSQRPFRIIIAIVTGFFICWFPHHIYPLIPHTDRLYIFRRCFFIISYLLAYFSSCLNPILYVFMGHKFKGNFKKALLSTVKSTFNDKEIDNSPN
ncbi:hypothetical protein GDO86_012224 [Hymenochirus boettgeri]|uniref:G-protein coupled receptors family 1 profile domain-containing protein n=1 Tax=Hymenochirus boettgeri TaxID=247094 RepID=A0A8T2ILQ5_9PIPI|nr:hypothetical protein GDO86_012224 [Hymenochirus boettgeri]